mgnify:CR=1 FL=1
MDQDHEGALTRGGDLEFGVERFDAFDTNICVHLEF